MSESIITSVLENSPDGKVVTRSVSPCAENVRLSGRYRVGEFPPIMGRAYYNQISLSGRGLKIATDNRSR